MHILSIDVGIRNLAYVIIKIDNTSKTLLNTGCNHEIEKWDVLELIEKSEKASTADQIKIGMSMMRQLDDILSSYTFDMILIENQIGKNAIKMKSIQGMLNMYFVMRNYTNENILNYNATHKLKDFCNGKKTSYNERKKMSKQITMLLCEKHYGDELYQYYKSFKKKRRFVRLFTSSNTLYETPRSC